MSTRYAFFDVDGTVVSIKTMFSFQEFWTRRQGDRGQTQNARFLQTMADLEREGASREVLNRTYYKFFAGRSVRDVEEAASPWYSAISEMPGFLHGAVVSEIRRHREEGTIVVFVSGSFSQILRPIAEELDVSHILCAIPLQEGDIFTGEIGTPQTIGHGKAVAMIDFLRRYSGESRHCWAYGDDISDLPMLSAVGHPIVVAGDPRLEEQARNFGWKVMSPTDSEVLM